MKKIVILGAGMTGLSAAYFLQKHGVDFSVYEKEASLGGLCRSLKIDGFTFDYAERFLRMPDENFKKFILGLMGGNIFPKELSASIYFKGAHVRFPFQKNLFDLPKSLRSECLKSYIRAAKKKQDYKNFAQWTRASFGEAIAKYFMIPYNKKIWAYAPAKMSVDWFRGEFLPKHDVKSVKEGAELPPEKRAENPAQIRWYPRHGGAQELPKALAENIDKRFIFYNKQAKRVDLKKRRVFFEDGKSAEYDVLITTMPLNELVDIIYQADRQIKTVAGKLKYNSAVCLNFGVDRQDVSDMHWIYFPEKKFIFSKLYFLRNFSENSVPKGQSVVSALVTYTKEKPLNRKDIEKKTLEGIKACGIIRKDEKADFIAMQEIKYAFAIPTIDLSQNRVLIQRFLRSKNIYSIGRYGNWEYSGMEHAVRAGKNIAEEVALL